MLSAVWSQMYNHERDKASALCSLCSSRTGRQVRYDKINMRLVVFRRNWNGVMSRQMAESGLEQDSQGRPLRTSVEPRL